MNRLVAELVNVLFICWKPDALARDFCFQSHLSLADSLGFLVARRRQAVESFGGLQVIWSKVLTTSAAGMLLSFVLNESALFAQARASSEPERPNVLFIAIDDLRPALGCYGDPLAKSPNIDQFAKSARQFNRAYVQQAVCGPSRTSLLTGLLPDHTQVWHNRNRFRETRPKHVTLPQLFKQNGYRILGFGKIFSGNEEDAE